MQKLILIRGLPGSGKTTEAKRLVQEGEAFTFVEADDYWIRKDGTYDFNPKLIKNAHEFCFKTLEDWMLNYNKTVIVSNTFTQIWEMQRYLDFAEKHGFEVEVRRCTEKYQNVHNVPEATIQKMKDRFEDYKGEVLIGKNDTEENNE